MKLKTLSDLFLSNPNASLLDIRELGIKWVNKLGPSISKFDFMEFAGIDREDIQ